MKADGSETQGFLNDYSDPEVEEEFKYNSRTPSSGGSENSDQYSMQN
jgi:hypothetical protein